MSKELREKQKALLRQSFEIGKLDPAFMLILEEVLAEMGYTVNPPPATKPEFKPGDVCVNVHDQIFIFDHYVKDSPYPYKSKGGGGYKTCRHADTWLKPESGEMPKITSAASLGKVWKTNEGPILQMHASRWCRLPE